MSDPPLFPSQEWCAQAARALQLETEAQVALAEFGAFSVGVVLEKGAGLAEDFCLHVSASPGADPKLAFCDDEDELEDLPADYQARVPHRLARELLRAVHAGQTPDLLVLLTSGQVKVRGDLGRVVQVVGRHPLAGLSALRSLPLRTIP
jgi:hypothetical protein